MEEIRTIKELLDKMNISEFQQYDDFHILKFKDHLNVIPFSTEARKCHFFQIIITRGHDVDVKLADTQFSAEQESISFISYQQLLSSKVNQVKEEGTAYMLVFSPRFLHMPKSNYEIIKQFPFFNINTSSTYFLDKEKGKLFFHYMESIYQCFHREEYQSVEVLKSYLSIVLFESKSYFSTEHIQNTFSSRSSEICYRFESLVKTYANSKHKIQFYANKLHISPVYLAECIKKQTGKTFKTVLNEYIVLEAKSLLVHTKDSIELISDRLGYSDASNFTSFFKRHVKETPNQYRKRNT